MPNYNDIASKGRYGDTTLMHVSPLEVEGLGQLLGRPLPSNPETGYPEAFPLIALAALAGAGIGAITGKKKNILRNIVRGAAIGGLGGAGLQGLGAPSQVFMGGEGFLGSQIAAPTAAVNVPAAVVNTPNIANAASKTAATTETAAGGGGIMNWVKNNPGWAFLGASGAASLLPQGDGNDWDDDYGDYAYEGEASFRDRGDPVFMGEDEEFTSRERDYYPAYRTYQG